MLGAEGERMILGMQYKALVLASLLLWSASGAGAELWEYDWVEVRGGHFSFVSALPVEQAQAIASELDTFHAALELLRVLSPNQEPAIPLYIVLLPRPIRELDLLGPYAVRNRIGLRFRFIVSNPDADPLPELQDAYRVHAVNTGPGDGYPLWVFAGLYRLLSDLRVSDGVLIYGSPSQGFRLPSRGAKLFAHLNPTGAEMSQSWLLTHYLMVGREEAFSGELADYAGRLTDGALPAVAFAAAFGMDPETLAPVLTDYIKAGARSGDRSFTAAPSALVVRHMAPDEASVLVADVFCCDGSDRFARQLYAEALRLNAENTDAIAGLARVFSAANRYDDAEPLLIQAVDARSDSAQHAIDYGYLSLERARQERDPATNRSLWLDAERWFQRALELAPDDVEALYWAGVAYVESGDQIEQGARLLEQALARYSSAEAIQVELAKAYLAAGDEDKARQLLHRAQVFYPNYFDDEFGEVEKRLTQREGARR